MVIQSEPLSALRNPKHKTTMVWLTLGIRAIVIPWSRYYKYFSKNFSGFSTPYFKALFFCEPFREKVLEYKKVNKKVADSLLSSLSHLFSELQKKRSNSVKPTKFIQMLKKENEIFDNILQHDAQEFLNYLLNHIGDTLKNDAKAKNSTWVHDLFQVRFGFILCV